MQNISIEWNQHFWNALSRIEINFYFNERRLFWMYSFFWWTFDNNDIMRMTIFFFDIYAIFCYRLPNIFSVIHILECAHLNINTPKYFSQNFKGLYFLLVSKRKEPNKGSIITAIIVDQNFFFQIYLFDFLSSWDWLELVRFRHYVFFYFVSLNSSRGLFTPSPIFFHCSLCLYFSRSSPTLHWYHHRKRREKNSIPIL